MKIRRSADGARTPAAPRAPAEHARRGDVRGPDPRQRPSTRPSTTWYTAVLALALGLVASSLAAADGDLDPDFSDDGKRLVQWSTSALVRAVAASPDGDIVLAGDGGGNWLLSRLGPDGSLDLGWGLSFDPFDLGPAGASSTGEVLAVGFYVDGEVIVAGEVRDGSSRLRPAVARLTAAGELDPFFSDDGLTIANTTPPQWVIQTIADARVALDGRVVFVGTCDDCPALGQTGTWALRLLASGAPDTNFSGDGWAAFSLAGVDATRARAVAIDESAAGVPTRYVLTGWGLDDQNEEQIWVARLNGAGALDATFGGNANGAVLLPTLAGRVPTDVAIDGNSGRVAIAVAAREPPGSGGGGLVGLTRSGVLDPDFGVDGFSDLDLEEGVELEAVGFQSNGRIVAAGGIDADGAQAGGFFLARTLADGSTDGSYDGNGVKRVEFDRDANAIDRALALTLSGGRLVTAGFAEGTSPSSTFAVARTRNALVFADGFERGNTISWYRGF